MHFLKFLFTWPFIRILKHKRRWESLNHSRTKMPKRNQVRYLNMFGNNREQWDNSAIGGPMQSLNLTIAQKLVSPREITISESRYNFLTFNFNFKWKMPKREKTWDSFCQAPRKINYIETNLQVEKKMFGLCRLKLFWVVRPIIELTLPNSGFGALSCGSDILLKFLFCDFFVALVSTLQY